MNNSYYHQSKVDKNLQDLKDIETLIYKKFKNRQCDLFYFDGDILSYDDVVREMAIEADQLCFDDEIELSQIENNQWDELFSQYNFAQEQCSCFRGCNKCLWLDK